MKRIHPLSVFLLFLPTQANALDEPNGPPPVPFFDEQFEATKKMLEDQCQAVGECGPERLDCFMEALHLLRESGQVCEDMFRRLLHYGEMRMAFRRGFEEGMKRGGEMCGPRPEPKEPPSEPPSDQPNDGEKVEICHVPPGNPENKHTIRVGSSAVDAHLAHGDTLGKCEGEKEKKEKPKKDKKGKKPKK